MASADLRLAEEQRGIMPAAIEKIDDDVRDTGHFRFVAAKPLDGAGDVAGKLCAIKLEMVGCQGEVGPILLQDVR